MGNGSLDTSVTLAMVQLRCLDTSGKRSCVRQKSRQIRFPSSAKTYKILFDRKFFQNAVVTCLQGQTISFTKSARLNLHNESITDLQNTVSKSL